MWIYFLYEKLSIWQINVIESILEIAKLHLLFVNFINRFIYIIFSLNIF